MNDAVIRRLFHRIDDGDLAGVKRILQSHPDINVDVFFVTQSRHRWDYEDEDAWDRAQQCTYSNLTPVAFAVRTKETDVVEVLLAHGAAVNGPVGAYITPLQQACLPNYGCADMVKLLLDHGAHIDATIDRERRAPITIACSLYGFSNLDIIQLLINAGADVNILSPYTRHHTPLLFGC